MEGKGWKKARSVPTGPVARNRIVRGYRTAEKTGWVPAFTQEGRPQRRDMEKKYIEGQKLPKSKGKNGNEQKNRCDGLEFGGGGGSVKTQRIGKRGKKRRCRMGQVKKRGKKKRWFRFPRRSSFQTTAKTGGGRPLTLAPYGKGRLVLSGEKSECAKKRRK